MCENVVANIRVRHAETPYTLNTVKAAADAILQATGEPRRGQSVGVVKICDSMGFKVFCQELPKEICGLIVVNDELRDKFGTDRVISVNVEESGKRRRFTVAHELAHYLFDFRPDLNATYTAFEREGATEDQAELLANRFAAELLMPAEHFRREYDAIQAAAEKDPSRLFSRIQELSDHFYVPTTAVEKRILELGLRKDPSAPAQ